MRLLVALSLWLMATGAGCSDDGANLEPDLRALLDLGAPGPGRTCDQAIDLTHETAPLAASTAGGSSQTSSSCDNGADRSPEMYFTYDAGDSAVDLIVDVVVDAKAPWDAVVTSRATCSDQSSESFCADNSESQRLEVLDATGPVTLVVDGTDVYQGASEGAFTIAVHQRPIVALGGDCDLMGVDNRCHGEAVCRAGKCVATSAALACAAAVDLSAALDASGATTVSGLVLPFEPGYYLGSCSFSPDPALPERIYQINVTAPSLLDATTDDPAATDYDTLLFLTQGACDGSELGCNDDVDYDHGEFRSHLRAALAPGNYYLFVDAASPTIYGRFDREPRHYQLTVTLTRNGD